MLFVAGTVWAASVLAMPSNILKYYLLRLFSGFSFTYVIQAIFLLSRGITVAQLAVFASLVVIFSTVLEIPTGYLADRFGRKYSVSFSHVVSGLGYLAFVPASDFNGLVVIAFLRGLSSALSSGALESLMYDEIQQNWPELSFLKVTTNGSNIAIVAAAFAAFVSPIIYLANPVVPFVLSGAVSLALSVFVLFFKEQGRPQQVARNLRILDGLRNVWTIEAVRLIVLIDLCLLIFVNIYYTVLFFPKIQSLGMQVEYLGVIDVVTLGITIVLLQWVARRAFKNEKTTLVVYSLAVAVAFVMFGLSSSLLPALIFGMLFDPLWNTRIHVIPTITNKYFDGAGRALNLSSMSFISKLGAALLVPIAIVFFTQSYWFSVLPLVAILLLLLKYPAPHAPEPAKQ